MITYCFLCGKSSEQCKCLGDPLSWSTLVPPITEDQLTQLRTAYLNALAKAQETQTELGFVRDTLFTCLSGSPIEFDGNGFIWAVRIVEYIKGLERRVEAAENPLK